MSQAKQKKLEEEIKYLNDNPQNNNNQNNAQFEIFETEINKIKNMLLERSKDISDNENRKIAEKTDGIIEELLHQNKCLIELNIKMKTFLNNLTKSYRNNNEEYLNKILEELSETSFDFGDNIKLNTKLIKNDSNRDLGNHIYENNKHNSSLFSGKRQHKSVQSVRIYFIDFKLVEGFC